MSSLVFSEVVPARSFHFVLEVSSKVELMSEKEKDQCVRGVGKHFPQYLPTLKMKMLENK